MAKLMRVGLGLSGPTDCCLTLYNNGRWKDYLIESIAWQLLSLYGKAVDAKLGQWIWDNRDGDVREQGVYDQ